MGLNKPMIDAEAQTKTFRKLKNEIVDRVREDIEKTTERRAQEANDIRSQRLEKEIMSLEQKNASLKEKAYNLQRKLAGVSGEAFLDDIKEKINAFFSVKLGKKSIHVLKEFNEKILEITKPDHSVENLLNSISSF